MSSNWPQEGQSQGGGNTGQQPSAPPSVRKHTLNRPPVCYNCDGEHFVIDCPQNPQNQGVLAALPSAPPPYRQPPRPGPPLQSFPPQGGPVQYPQYPSNQQYGPPATPYPSYPPPQQPYTAPYTAPPPNQQYPQPGVQPPTYNQYNQNSGPPQGPPQYSGPVYQPPPPQYNSTRPPAPYRAPVNPPYPRTPGYRYDYQPTGTPAYYGPTSSQPQPPLQQWNSTPSTSQSPYPKPQRNNSGFKREFSGTPSHHSQQQYQPVRSQSQQLDHLPDAPHRTPQTPSSNSGKAQQAPQQSSQDSPAKQQIGSIPSTPASQSNNRRASVPPNTVGLSKAEQVAPVVKDEPEAEVQPEQEAEEGEVQEGDESDDEEERFSWELEVMFREPPKLETVALAQPLSAGFESTPVPLVQAWSTNVPSISRYARKDNLKEFVRSVRSAPQWSYLQEDPAFAEITDEGDPIPLSELAAWMDIHHGRAIVVEEAENESISRKRARPDGENAEQDDEQENVDQQIALEVATEEQGKEPPSKRQKNEETDGLDEMMRSPGGRTPTYLISNRGGTPCLATTDDAWAPQPGECATSPGDPTENLLASLGVTGDAKPVAQESLPPYMPKEEQDRSAHSSQTQTPVVTQQSTQGPPANTSGPVQSAK
ncbi:hypothetical protein BDZ45DRAFT_400772 [Acephala macrosclerotiorum]|nr:hypothetical protein BDZ45DRAFT_400772 [Acephala macrosclerotiorum]